VCQSARVLGSGRALLLLVALAPILVQTRMVFAQSGTAGFGLQWVESHPFTTWAWSFGNNTLAQYDDDNFSNLFTNSLGGGSYQTPWLALGDISESLTTIDTRLEQPYITINYIDDEPSNSQLPTIASNTTQTRTIRPDLPVLVNALGSGSNYNQYLSNIVSEVNPDILSFDNYPFQTGNSSYNSSFFSSLMAVRAESLQAKIPFFDWVQAYGGGSAQYPSESELRMNVFSSLTAGSKGIGYYSFGIQSGDSASLLTSSDTPGTLYPIAQNINSQLSKIGPSLRDLTSTGVGFLFGNAQSVEPSGLSSWTKGTGGDPHLINAGTDNGSSGNSSQNALLGFFTDSLGQNYFMLTNLYCGTNLTSAQTNNTIQLAFDSSVNSLLELDPVTGQPDVVPLVNHVLTITLGGGQGELFKYNTGTFAGISPQWSPNSSGDWNVTTNWNGGIVPNGVDSEADFFGAITGNHTVFTDVPVTVGTIDFNNSNTYEITGPGSLTLQTSVLANAQVIVQAGTQEINLPTTIASNTIFNVATGATLVIGNPLTINSGETLSTTGGGTVKYESIVNVQGGGAVVLADATHASELSLAAQASASITSSKGGAVVEVDSLSNSGTFNVANNELIVNYKQGADPIASIQSQLTRGYAGGNWNGTGINSSFAANHAGYALAYADGADNTVSGLGVGQIEVTYTLYGDVNLDGVVDGNDLAIFAANFGKSGTDWDQGDFNYGGATDGSDFALLAANFGRSASGATMDLPSSDWSALDNFAAENGLLADVPEPSTLGLLLLATMGFFGLRVGRLPSA
jgi:PEP-CTERM motif-containing protein